MSIKVGINGYGRIGRIIMRILQEIDTDIEVVGINVRSKDLDRMVYQTKYDSVFGRMPGSITCTEDELIINGHAIKVYAEANPENIPWSDCGAEYIFESTGKYTTYSDCLRHLQGGAKRVILTAPAKDSMPTFVYGVNELVSQDVRRSFCTCVFDVKADIMLDKTFVKLIAWYDNEWGYSTQCIHLLEYIAGLDQKKG